MIKGKRKQDFINFLENNFPETYEDIYDTCRFKAGQGDVCLAIEDVFESIKLSTLKAWYPEEYQAWLNQT